jgi:predicted TIM-barrel fold metal-dependent hydrolase
MSIAVVDSHTHVVSADRVRYPVTPAVDEELAWHHERPTDVEALLELASQSGVRGVALVQALSCHGYDNRYVLDGAAAHRDHAVAIVAVRLGDPTASEQLRRHGTEDGARGVRLVVANPTSSAIDRTEAGAVVMVADDLDLPVVLLGVAPQLASIPDLVTAFPAVRFVLDHCGFADVSGDTTFPHAADLFALAKFDNLYLKVSSITLRSTAHPEMLWSALVERFGSHRVMWGSDYPHTNGDGYRALVDSARATTDHLASSEQADVLANTASGLWPELA